MADPNRTIIGNDVFPPEVLLEIARYTQRIPTLECRTAVDRNLAFVCRTWYGPFFEAGLSDVCITHPRQLECSFAQSPGASLFVRTLRVEFPIGYDRDPKPWTKPPVDAEGASPLKALLATCSNVDTLSIHAHWQDGSRVLLEEVPAPLLHRLRRLHLEAVGWGHPKGQPRSGGWFPLLSRIVPNLVSISFKNCSLQPINPCPPAEIFLPSLQSAQFHDTSFGRDALASFIIACPSLRDLRLANAPPGMLDPFFSALQRAPNLRRLAFDSISIYPRTPFLNRLLPVLRDLNLLESLEVIGMMPSDDSIPIDQLLALLPSSLQYLTTDFPRSVIQPFVRLLESDEERFTVLKTVRVYWKTFYPIEDEVVMERRDGQQKVSFLLRTNVPKGRSPDISCLPLT